jgi:prevent-host-death family protein
MERIGVRELRQHASRYLARVATGESIEVTDRGRPVALLVPVPTDPWEEMIASGLVIRGNGESVLDDGPVDFGFSASEELEAMRADER